MIDRRPNAIEHNDAYGGDHHAIRTPLEQYVTELSLELGQPLSKRGLGQAHRVGGDCDAVVILNCEQRAQVPQVQIEWINRHLA